MGVDNSSCKWINHEKHKIHENGRIVFSANTNEVPFSLENYASAQQALRCVFLSSIFLSKQGRRMLIRFGFCRFLDHSLGSRGVYNDRELTEKLMTEKSHHPCDRVFFSCHSCDSWFQALQLELLKILRSGLLRSITSCRSQRYAFYHNREAPITTNGISLGRRPKLPRGRVVTMGSEISGF